MNKKLKEIKVLVENKEKTEGYCVVEGKDAKAEIMRKYWDKRKAKMRKEK